MRFSSKLNVWLVAPAAIASACLFTLSILPPRSRWILLALAIFISCATVGMITVAVALVRFRKRPEYRIGPNCLLTLFGAYPPALFSYFVAVGMFNAVSSNG